MGTTYRLDVDDSSPAFRELIRGTWGWKNCVAVAALLGGLAAPIAASILTVISWFSNRFWHGLSFRNAGTALFVIAIPLLILGAHCLDLLDKDKHKSPGSGHTLREQRQPVKNWRGE